MAKRDAAAFATDCHEVAGLPYRRPIAYPVSFHCDCTGDIELMTEMVRDASTDLPGETPRARFYAGRNEVFTCPGCGAVELFPFVGMGAYELAECHPGFGEERGAA